MLPMIEIERCFVMSWVETRLPQAMREPCVLLKIDWFPDAIRNWYTIAERGTSLSKFNADLATKVQAQYSPKVITIHVFDYNGNPQASWTNVKPKLDRNEIVAREAMK